VAYTELNDKHFDRLTEAVDWNYRQQKVDRTLHQTLLDYMMGEHYPRRNGTQGPQTTIALMSMTARAMSRRLISKEPRMLVNVQNPQWKSWSENAEIAANKRIVASDAANVLREVVGQSMVSFGVLFTAPVYVGTPKGMRLDLGFESIDRADYVFDLDSPTLEGPDFEGHKFRMKIADIREHPLFDPDVRMQIEPNGAEDSPDDEISNYRRAFGQKRGLYDYAEIFCVYDRPRNKLVYYPRHQPTMRLLETEWLGPRHGPYRKLYYEKVAGNAIPLSPMMHLLTKHKAFNILDMKTIHQQQVAKWLLVYSNAGKEEAERVVNAVNNQSVLAENGAVRGMHIGGAAPDTVAMAEKQKRDFSYASGGVVDQFMQQADTFGSERLLRSASNELLEDMSGWSAKFVKGFCEDVFTFDLSDPDETPRMIEKKMPTSGTVYRLPWTRLHRQTFADCADYDVDVEPYSYVERSPDSRLADLLGALQIIQGMGDQAAVQGISIDVEAVVRTVAKYKDLPELYDVLILNQDPERLQQLLGPRSPGGTSDPNKPNGNYTRRSESDGSGAEMEVMRAFGRGSQQNEIMVA